MPKQTIGSLKLEVRAAGEALALVGLRAGGGCPASACLGYLNPHVYNVGAAEPQVAAFLERCQAVCLDGIGVVLAARLLHRQRLPRAPMHQVFDAGVAAGLLRGRVLLLGLEAREIACAAIHLARAAPAAEIVACHHGFRPLPEYAAILRDHDDADFVLAGMGTPRSEQVLLLAERRCRHALCWHVGGGSLRQWAGTKPRAPPLVSRLGLEWLHRVVHEPATRSRYASGIPAFARRVWVDARSQAHAGGHGEDERCGS